MPIYRPIACRFIEGMKKVWLYFMNSGSCYCPGKVAGNYSLTSSSRCFSSPGCEGSRYHVAPVAQQSKLDLNLSSPKYEHIGAFHSLCDHRPYVCRRGSLVHFRGMVGESTRGWLLRARCEDQGSAKTSPGSFSHNDKVVIDVAEVSN